MLQYADDIAYASKHFDDEAQPSGPLGAIGSMGWNIAKFEFSWKTMEMLRDAPNTGYYVPFTRGGKGKIARLGKRMGWWGDSGKILAKGMEGAGKYYNRPFGVLRYAASRKAAINAVGEKAASIAGTKFLVGRAAGLALRFLGPVFWGQMAWSASAGIYQAASSMVQKYRGLEMGGYFPETQASVTSRQRAVQAITASRLQARSAIGNEAMLFHR